MGLQEDSAKYQRFKLKGSWLHQLLKGVTQQKNRNLMFESEETSRWVGVFDLRDITQIVDWGSAIQIEGDIKHKR